MNLWEMADLQLPWCLHVVATLRIAQRIEAGTTDVRQLAHETNCDVAALRSVIEYLAAKGVFTSSGDGSFQLNEMARGLLEPALLLGLDLNGIGGRMAGAWSTLPGYVRTGKPAYHEAYGLSFWDDLEAHPDIAASFDALIGPEGHGDFNGSFDLSCGWDEIRTVADIGGGTGAMLEAMLRLHLHLHGILVELPRTVERARERFRAAKLDGRITLAPQSFFEPLPRGADVYLLRGVLANWDDMAAVKLLQRCAEALSQDGCVVILKNIHADDERAGLSISDILTGGRERSVSEVRKLAAQAGLEIVSASRQRSGYFVTELRKAQ